MILIAFEGEIEIQSAMLYPPPHIFIYIAMGCFNLFIHSFIHHFYGHFLLGQPEVLNRV